MPRSCPSTLTWWLVESSFLNVTVSPTLTVSVFGTNAKFFSTIVVELPPVEPPPVELPPDELGVFVPDEQPTTATTKAAMQIIPRIFGRCRLMVSLLYTCCS